MIFAPTAPAALDKEIRLGSRCLLNTAIIKIGKYGSGIKTITLPIKLAIRTPRYPMLSKNPKRLLIISSTKRNFLWIYDNIYILTLY